MKSFRLVRRCLGSSLLTGATIFTLLSSGPVLAEAAVSGGLREGSQLQFSMFAGSAHQAVGESSEALLRAGFDDAGVRVLGLEQDHDGLNAEPVLDFSPEETPSELRPFHGRLGVDLRDLVRMPASMDRRQWVRLGASVLAVGAVSLLDDEIRSSVASGSSSGSQDFARTIRPIGQEVGLAFLGVSWLAGRAFDRPGLQAMAADGAEATLLSAGLITPALKGLVGRSRPRDGLGSTSFSGSHSFPSGEVTEVFAIASVVAAHSERKWTRGLAWGLAGAVAWQRMELDGHWASDVVAGALIGAGTGRWVVRRNRPELRERRRWTMAPQIGKGSYGLGFRIALGRGPQAPHEG